MNIVIIDYGMGNVHSVQNALTFLGFDSNISSNPEDIQKADVLVFPGVGAFGQGMEELNKRSLVEPIKAYIESKKPFLGICLGIQLLFETSEEAPAVKGLGILKGKVVCFNAPGLKIPHMGWNSLEIKKTDPIFKDINEKEYFYFVHSYYPVPDDENIIAATTEYGSEFCSMVIKENIVAMQFHPEKSQKAGLKLLQNFLGDVVDF